MSQRLEIEIGLSKDAAVDSARRLRAELKGMAEGVTADAKTASEAETQIHKKARDERGRFLKQGAEEAERAYKKTGDAGRISFGQIATAAGGVVTVVQSVVAQVAQLAAGLDRVGEKSRALTREFSSQRDRTRELAAVEGKTPDNAFTLGIHRFARGSGLSFDEALGFRSNFANTATQFLGRNINQSEFDQYRAMSAKAMARTGASPEASASFASMFLTRDLNPLGDKAAEEAFRRQFQIASIYDAGAGTASQNFGAFAQLKSAFEADPQMQGAFKSDQELAIIGSVANAAGPDRQRDQVNDLVRNLRRPDNKELNALKQRAGVTNKMGIRQTIETLAPLLVKEAKATGQGLDQVIGKYIPDAGAREALSIQIGRGVLGGEYKQRQGVADASGAAGAGERALSEFMASEAGQGRVAEADIGLAEAERGAQNSPLEVIRKQALARLVRDQRIDSNASAVQDFLSGKMSFGFLGDPDQRRINDETQRLLNARLGESSPISAAVTPMAIEQELRDRITGARQRGIDPLKPNPAAEAGIDTREGVFIKDAVGTDASRQQALDTLKEIAANTAPAQAPPKPLVATPPTPRR
jgi:hypothetical protein